MSEIPGLGFYPTNEQLLLHYLKQRILESSFLHSPSTHAHIIPDIDFEQWKPWDLPTEVERLSTILGCGREQWYFFHRRNKDETPQERRVGNVGYWKETGKGKKMRSESSNEVIGSKKTSSFYLRDGVKTNWVVRECYLEDPYAGNGQFTDSRKVRFVVCCLYKTGEESRNDESDSSSDEGESSECGLSDHDICSSEDKKRERQEGRMKPIIPSPSIQKFPTFNVPF